MPFPKTIPAEEPIEPDGLIVAIIGPPDAGKSLTAQTAHDAYTWAFDSGLYRTGYKQESTKAYGMTWAESELNTLTKEEWEERNLRTLVIDTGGGALRKLRAHLISKNPNLIAGGSFIPKGYGILGEEWANLLWKFKYDWKTDLVLVDHIREVTVKEEIIERIDMLGQMTVAEVYKEADLIGRQRRIEEKQPNGTITVRHTISFSGNDRAFRKDPVQFGEMEIPDLRQPENRRWLGNLMDALRVGIVERQRETNTAGNLIKDIYTLVDAQPEPNVDIAAAATEALAGLIAAKATQGTVMPMIERLREAGYAYDAKARTFAVADAPAAEEQPVLEEAQS